MLRAHSTICRNGIGGFQHAWNTRQFVSGARYASPQNILNGTRYFDLKVLDNSSSSHINLSNGDEIDRPNSTNATCNHFLDTQQLTRLYSTFSGDTACLLEALFLKDFLHLATLKDIESAAIDKLKSQLTGQCFCLANTYIVCLQIHYSYEIAIILRIHRKCKQ